MIDPLNITNFAYTDDQLEELIIFCIAVAGKNATTVSKAVDKFIHESPQKLNDKTLSPFAVVAQMIKSNALRDNLERARVGKYSLLEKSLKALTSEKYNLRTVSIEDLEKIPGIGKKTSRFFVVHSRPDQRHAILDVHIMRWLGEQGHTVTTGTPAGKFYDHFEKIFIAEADKRNRKIAELDLEIWKEQRSRA